MSVHMSKYTGIILCYDSIMVNKTLPNGWIFWFPGCVFLQTQLIETTHTSIICVGDCNIGKELFVSRVCVVCVW